MQTPTSLFTHDLVLVGGGHTHALLLLRLAMSPIPGVRVTLVSEASESPYSGMLPGLVAGHYQRDDVYIDLRNLCRYAGVRFIQGRVERIDPAAQRIYLEHRPPLEYDVLSLNVGATPDLTVQGAAEFTVPVKPIAGFWQAWLQQREWLLQQKQSCDIAVVGGGAGSVELALAMAHSLRNGAARHHLHLVSRSEQLLPGYPKLMLNWLQTRLQQHQIQVHLQADVAEVTETHLHFSNRQSLQADKIFWCTQARGVSWLSQSELDTTDGGFVRVNPTLQTLRWPNIFAAGDCAWIDATPTPRAGVYAVRQAPCLDDNLRRYFSGQPLKQYRPQRRFLSLLATGDIDAVGARGAISLAGKWLWRWKDHIDRRFMTMLQKLPILPPPTEDQQRSLEPPTMRCGGCGGKVGADVLQQALAGLNESSVNEPGMSDHCELSEATSPVRDDAALIPLGNRDDVLVQSVDAIKPLLDDPWQMGRIATLHALSDLYAMNAEPHSVQLQIQLPILREVLQVRDMQHVLQGVQHELQRAGATLLGGHTLEGESLQVGLTVNGFAKPADILRKGGAQEGDLFVLTKPLGTGTVFAAAMRGFAKARWIDAALPVLLQSNREAARILSQHGARALTDITGFGLAGHWLEMLDAADLGARLSLLDLPVLDGALDCLQAGYHSTLSPANQRARHRIQMENVDATDPRYALLFDPQTQGGLLAAMPANQAHACVAALHNASIPAAIVGVCEPGSGLRIVP